MPEKEENTQPTKGGIWSQVGKGVAILAAAVITWAVTLFWDEFQEVKGAHEAVRTELNAKYEKAKKDHAETEELLKDRIKNLESDNAKWATMAKMQEDIVRLKTQQEVMRQVWSYEYGREVPTGFPKRQGEPKLVPPEELFRNVDQYRMIQQKRYPNQKK